jgi:RNA polymerase sigma-70 factor, ECF subfamily
MSVGKTPPLSADVHDEDAPLLARAQAHDYEAFEALVRKHQKRVYAVAFGVVRDASEAEEVAQETFLSAFTHLDTFRGDARFSTWLFRVATNHALMKLRKKRPIAVGGNEELEDTLLHSAQTQGTSPFAALTQWAKRPDDALVDDQLQRAVDRALDRLPDNDRALLLTRAMNNASHDELAAAFSMTVPAVKSRLHRIRLTLRQLLDDSL